MINEFMKKWAEALRSGEFKQTTGALKKGNQHSASYCCLGVARELFPDKINKERGEGILDQESLAVLGISDDEQQTLIDMNDNENKSFKQIADYIEFEIGFEE
tara:strand:+ start:486 stop:794 length:309 start_codon:yes stop_codon:yes gene_type:complete